MFFFAPVFKRLQRLFSRALVFTYLKKDGKDNMTSKSKINHEKNALIGLGFYVSIGLSLLKAFFPPTYYQPNIFFDFFMVKNLFLLKNTKILFFFLPKAVESQIKFCCEIFEI